MQNPVLQVKNLSKAYASQEILTGISFKVMPGDIVGLIGENGAGKTTMMNIIAGLRKPSGGAVAVCGKTLNRNGADYYANIGFAFDSMAFYPYMNAVENLHLFTDDNDKIDTLLAYFGLGESKGRMVSTYSLGMRQKLNLIRAVICEPKLIVMDEPINGLDPKAVADFKQYIKEHQGALLISSHALKELLFFCNKYIFIKNKNIFAQIDAQESPIESMDSYIDTMAEKSSEGGSNKCLDNLVSMNVPHLMVERLHRIYFRAADVNSEEIASQTYVLQQGQTVLENIYLSM